MTVKKKRSFFSGAVILMLSGVFVKGMGALFKIPLASAVGDEAMGYFSSAYSVYSMLFLISTAGVPAALSRLIAAAEAEGDEGKTRRIFRVSFLLLAGVGLFFALALFFLASPIARIPKEPELEPLYRTLSPLLFFISVSAAFRGYFQGRQNMIPTAVSQVIEASSNLAFGLSFGIRAQRAALPPVLVAQKILSGVVIGAALSALFLSLVYAFKSRRRAAPSGSRRKIVKELLAIALPVTLSAAILSLCGVIDSVVAVRRFKETVLDSSTVQNLLSSLAAASAPAARSSGAVALYGAYASKAMTLFSLTPTLVTPIATSLLPAAGAAKAKGDAGKLAGTVSSALKGAFLLALPASAGLFVLSGPVIRLLFPADQILFYSASGEAVTSHGVVPPMLSLLALAIPFAAFVSVAGAALQGTGQEKKSVVSGLLGVSAKLLAVLFLPAVPAVGVYALPLSTLLCYLVMALMHHLFLRRSARVPVRFLPLLAGPFVSALACGAAAAATFSLLPPKTPAPFSVFLSVFAGAAVYGIFLLLTGAVRLKKSSKKRRSPRAAGK